jgi:hypothetical protein
MASLRSETPHLRRGGRTQPRERSADVKQNAARLVPRSLPVKFVSYAMDATPPDCRPAATACVLPLTERELTAGIKRGELMATPAGATASRSRTNVGQCEPRIGGSRNEQEARGLRPDGAPMPRRSSSSSVIRRPKTQLVAGPGREAGLTQAEASQVSTQSPEPSLTRRSTVA